MYYNYVSELKEFVASLPIWFNRFSCKPALHQLVPCLSRIVPPLHPPLVCAHITLGLGKVSIHSRYVPCPTELEAQAYLFKWACRVQRGDTSQMNLGVSAWYRSPSVSSPLDDIIVWHYKVLSFFSQWFQCVVNWIQFDAGKMIITYWE